MARSGVIIFSTDGLAVEPEIVWIECDGAKLYSEIHRPDVVPAPALLICHGMNAKGFHLLKIYNKLAETARSEGFEVLVFDFRGVGRSTGQFDYGFKEQKDVRCALNFLSSRKDVLNNRIFVVGHSLGGAVALYALQDEKRVKGLALWSVPKNHDYNVRKFIRNARGNLGLQAFLILSRLDRFFNISKLFRLEVYGINLRQKNVREKLMKLDECEAASRLHGLPLLVVNGEDDDIVGVDEAKAVYESANEPKDLLIIKSADHTYRGKEDELVQKTMDWIKSLDGKKRVNLGR